MRLYKVLLAGAVVVGMVAACSSSSDSSGSDCTTGESQVCKCASGASALAQCVDGKLSTCPCGADASTDAPASGDGGDGGTGNREGGVSTSDAGFGQYLGPCNVMADCPPDNICFQFGTKGLVCTKSCTDSTQCPPPSPKCNPKMVCAPPD